MGDGRYCFPLTVTDAHSRYLLACDGRLSTQTTGAMATFERLFRELGLPQTIRTDDGVPFSTAAIGGLSQLTIWWTKLGIVHQRIEPGKPQQNGRHERMHKPLKAEATRPAQKDLQAQQARFDAFIDEFNFERPHEAIGQRTPASLYVPSSRALPAQLPEPRYPEHFQVRLVRGRASAAGVSGAGTFRLHGWQTHISEVLSGQHIGLESAHRIGRGGGRYLGHLVLRAGACPLRPEERQDIQLKRPGEQACCQAEYNEHQTVTHQPGLICYLSTRPVQWRSAAARS
jgi:hypothetical protein